MSSGDRTNHSSFSESASSPSGFAAIASNISSNSTIHHNSLASSRQGTSPTTSDDISQRNPIFSPTFTLTQSNGLTSSMLVDEVGLSASSAFHHDYDHNNDHMNISTSKKRSRILSASDNKVEDILSQICNEMDKLSTSDKASSNEDKIGAFIQVLQCAHDEAYFYLESSAWDTETAVMLWLDNHNDTISSSYQHITPAYREHTYFEHHNADKHHHHISSSGNNKRWRAREVIIDGLDKEWAAYVSDRTGHIYFIHKMTGYQQQSVPPGFADLPINISLSSHHHDVNDDLNDDNDSTGNHADVDDDERRDDVDDDDGMLTASAGDVIVQAEAILVHVHPSSYHAHDHHDAEDDADGDIM